MTNLEHHAEHDLHEADGQRDREELALEIEEMDRREPFRHADAEERTAQQPKEDRRHAAQGGEPRGLAHHAGLAVLGEHPGSQQRQDSTVAGIVQADEKLLAAHAAQLKERLQGVRVKATAQQAADGTLVVMEGWAEKETSDKVDALLEAYPNVVYLKGDPTPEDDTPVKLKNNRFARVFELVGDMYARPKYGTTSSPGAVTTTK